ncbi:hypothetical protein [Streptomyces malaysiensis]|uniref:hypothetical protein n=1 Tax=Streptomyces malaysiensis TaxID=92644 RepID=UPI000852ABCF|nr:hypothetical protein [Streptomyces sp. SPMA113]
MTSTAWSIDVPLTPPRPGCRHIFTGVAETKEAALAAARRAHETALLYTAAGQDIPCGSSRRDWSARGLHVDWDLDWSRAKTTPIVL